MLHAEMWHGRLTEVRKSARGTLRCARGILVYGVAGLETFFSKLDHCKFLLNKKIV